MNKAKIWLPALIVVAGLIYWFTQSNGPADSLRSRGMSLRQLDSGEIVSVEMKTDQFNDSDLETVSKIETLESLNASNSSITNEGLQHLQKLPKLEYLSLANTSVDDSAIPTLTELKSLETLVLDGCAVSPEALKALAGLPNLIELSVYDVSIPYKELLQLEDDLGENTDIFINAESVFGSPEEAKAVYEWDDQRMITIQLTEDSPADILSTVEQPQLIANLLVPVEVEADIDYQPATTFENLKEVKVGQEIDDDDFILLVGLDHLRYLTLENANITSDGLDRLPEDCVLESLEIISQSPLASGLKNFGRLGTVKLLRLSFPNAEQSAFDELSELHPDLESLSLIDSPITCEQVEFLEKLRKMSFVNLAGTNVTDECVDYLRKLRHITHIELRGSKVTPDIAATFAIGG
ncbi:hypothetical protein AB1L42_21415 [Thalassoglobus sp. JC818]|uniref:hypothetical protein n=1 Tax=Thalassoglobus sp. JC818 TaxID=3232136 RepID=UPI00345B46A7